MLCLRSEAVQDKFLVGAKIVMPKYVIRLAGSSRVSGLSWVHSLAPHTPLGLCTQRIPAQPPAVGNTWLLITVKSKLWSGIVDSRS